MHPLTLAACIAPQLTALPNLCISHPPPILAAPQNGSCGDLCLSPQVGKSGHSSVEDARATMELYKVVEEEWEQHLRQNPEQK